jgi:hypothetical protein
MDRETNRIEMTANDLRLLADSMGGLDEVVVDVGIRLAREFWHAKLRTLSYVT